MASHPDSSVKTEDPIPYIEYDIWKIMNYGRKQKRLYESQAMFNRTVKHALKYNFKITAYRFTSHGWKQLV